MFDLKIEEGKNVSIKPKQINQDTNRLWGTNRSLLNNAIIGASTGYTKTLVLSGVGFSAALKGKHMNNTATIALEQPIELIDSKSKVINAYKDKGYHNIQVVDSIEISEFDGKEIIKVQCETM